MKVRYNKTQTQETEEGKKIKLSFTGSFQGLVYNLSIAGEVENIGDFMKENNLNFYGQTLDLEIENKQPQLDKFE